MNILLTGANGFIGQYARRVLLAKHALYCLQRNVSNVKTSKRYDIIHADLTSPDIQSKLPSNIDCVLHLAQSNQYRSFPDGTEDMRRVNIDATCQLLEWARKSGVKQFIYASSANVYGKSSGLLAESYATQPDSFYGATKLAAEHLVRQYDRFFQIDILRLFTVYGPGQKNMLIPNMIERLRTNQVITLAQGVGLYMTPVYIDDATTIIRRLIETPSNTQVRLLNVCGDKVIHLGEIVKTLEALSGQLARIQHTDEEVNFFTGSNEALKRCLGQTNFTDIEIALELTVKGVSSLH